MSYERSIKREEPQQDHRRASECLAHGCPLPAVFTTQMRGSNFLCRAHESTEAHDWPAITDRVRKIERAFLAALDLTNASAGDKPDAYIVAKFVAMSPELAVPAGVTARTYGAFLMSRLLDKVRPKYVAPVIPTPSNEGLRKLDIQL